MSRKGERLTSREKSCMIGRGQEIKKKKGVGMIKWRGITLEKIGRIITGTIGIIGIIGRRNIITIRKVRMREREKGQK